MTTLREYRATRNLTLNDVAERSGLSESHLSLIERGLRNPSVSALHKIAAGLGITFQHAVTLYENREEARAA